MSRRRPPFAARPAVRCWLSPSDCRAMLAQSAGTKAVGASAAGADGRRSSPGLVKEWTTRPEFISPLVDHLPKVAGIPSPKDVLGHHIGEPKRLTYYADILKLLPRARRPPTPRVKIVPIGTSNEGRDLVVVFVGSDESIQNLEQYRTYLGQLCRSAHDHAGAGRADVIAKAKPIYHLMRRAAQRRGRAVRDADGARLPARDGGLAARQPDPRQRHRLDHAGRRSRRPRSQRRLVLPLRHQRNRRPYDRRRRAVLGQATSSTTTTATSTTRRSRCDRCSTGICQWHPPIMHDLHQAQTLLYTFSGQAPQNPNLDPILYGELPMMANFEMAQMAKYGMPGVWTHGFVDMWSPGYLAFMSSNHNGMIRMYEIQGFSGANTQKMRLGRRIARRGGRAVVRAGRTRCRRSSGCGGGRGNQSQREWFRPWPATGEFDWSLRNNTNYGETGVLTALQHTSTVPEDHPRELLRRSRATRSRPARKETVAGYVIPAGQRDMTARRAPGQPAAHAGHRDRPRHRRGEAPGRHLSRPAPSSSNAISRTAGLAKTLLEKQVYPDPNLRTYDDASWTMGLMSHADVKEIADKNDPRCRGRSGEGEGDSPGGHVERQRIDCSPWRTTGRTT